MDYPDALASEIQRATASVELPSEAELKHLLNVAFFAGLEEEEGRPLCFSLAHVRPERIDAGGHPPFSALAFTVPVRLTVRELVKLAPALDRRIASIGVREGAAGLEIWGLFRHGSTEFDRLEGRESGSYGVGFDYLRVSCPHRGRLDIEIGDWRVASFVGGQLRRGGSRLFSERGPIAEILVSRGKAQGDVGRIEAMQQVVWEVRANGHGGTIILLPDENPDHLRMGKYSVVPQSRASHDLRDRGRERSEAMQTNSDLLQRAHAAMGSRSTQAAELAFDAHSAFAGLQVAAREHKDAISFLAGLAAVDGALVLGPDLHVLSFGAMIEWSSESPRVSLAATSAGGVIGEPISAAELGGARHQSAAHFCAKRPGAIAFVVSQDGAVCCLYNDGRSLRAWRDIRLDRRPAPGMPPSAGTSEPSQE